MSTMPQRAGKRILWRTFFAWLFAALAFRSALALLVSGKITQIEQSGIAADGALYYSPLAASLASGNGLALRPGEPLASHMPVYPLLLAGGTILAHSPERAVLLVQTLAGALVVSLIFLLAELLLCRPVAHLSAALALFSPDLAIYSLLNSSDGPYLVFFLLGCLFLLLALRRESFVWICLAGLALSLGTLTRESAAGVGLIGCLVLVSMPGTRTSRQRFARAGSLLLAIVLTMMPWWMRNWIAIGDFIPLTTKGAMNLYMSTVIRPYHLTDYRNEALQTVNSTITRDQEIRSAVAGSPDRKERDRIYLAAAAANIREDPWAQIAHLGRKFGFFWEANIGPRHASRVGLAPILWLASIAYYGLLLVGALGLWILRSKRLFVATLVLPSLYFALAHVLIGESEPRYHLPVLPMMMLAASFVLWLWVAPKVMPSESGSA